MLPTMRKLAALLSAFLVSAGCFGEVIYIPGWVSGKRLTEDCKEIELLKTIYPGEPIKLMNWDAVVRWETAKANAEAFASEVERHLAEKSDAERAEVILIGHSLGGRIALLAAGRLATQGRKIRQFVLLGAAADCGADLSALARASTGTNISIFSRSDNILKVLYGNYEKNFPLGFCGASDPPAERFAQYELVRPEMNLELPDSTPAILLSLNYEELSRVQNHQAVFYIGELQSVVAGKSAPWRPRFDYSGVKIDRGALSIPENWVVPPIFKMEILEEYAQWSLRKQDISYRRENKDGEAKEHTVTVYFIVDHHGRIVLWNLWKYPLRRRFDNIKRQIRPL